MSESQAEQREELREVMRRRGTLDWRDRIYYEERLEDLTLLDHAVVFPFGAAVPIGGKRRGGDMPVPSPAAGRRVIEQLKGVTDFPNLRYMRAGRDYSAAVRWGDDPPAFPSVLAPEHAWQQWEIDIGRHYGYSESAIAMFVRRKSMRGSLSQ